MLLEELQPFERAVFLLREVFAYEFAEIATMLDKSEAACRRSFSRAKLHPIRGRDAVARFSLGTVRFLPEDYQMEIAEVNGQAAVIIRTGSQALFVLSIEVEAERIQAIRIIANPDKLARV